MKLIVAVVGVYEGWTCAQQNFQRKRATCQKFFPKKDMWQKKKETNAGDYKYTKYEI